MSGGRRNVGRSESDGLNATERRILAMWDAGRSAEEIASQIGWPRANVMNRISALNGGGEERAARVAATLGSASLLAAIRATGRQFA